MGDTASMPFAPQTTSVDSAVSPAMSSSDKGPPVALDLSGDLMIHVSSPLSTDWRKDDGYGQQTKPLFNLGSLDEEALFPFPSIHVGVKYDFRRRWSGVERVGMRLEWDENTHRGTYRKGYHKSESLSVASQELGENTISLPSQRTRYRPNFRLGVESGLTYSENVEVEAGIIMPHLFFSDEIENDRNNFTPLPTLSASWNSEGCVVLDVQAPAGRRIGIVSRTSFPFEGEGEDKSLYRDRLIRRLSSEIPSKRWDGMRGSWMPEVSVTGGGKLTALGGMGFGKQQWPRRFESDTVSKSNCRFGLRFTISRNLSWNMLGITQNDDEDDGRTQLRLEICGINSKGNSYNSVMVDALLEEILQSTRVTLFHNHIAGRDPT